MQLTPNFDIAYADTGDNVSIEDITAAMADSVDDALVEITAGRANLNYRWADAAARTAQAGMIVGYTGYQVDTGITYKYDGTVWDAWQSDFITWSTAPTNLTVGTGGAASSLQRYKLINGKALVDYKFVLGASGASVGTGPYITLPFNIVNPTARFAVLTGDGNIYDLSATTNYYTKVRVNDASLTQVLISSYAGTFANITATLPMAFGAGDMYQGEFWVEPA